jgi:hypothetical protein
MRVTTSISEFWSKLGVRKAKLVVRYDDVKLISVDGKEVSGLHEVSHRPVVSRCLGLGEVNICFGELLVGSSEDGLINGVDVREDLTPSLGWKTNES